MAKTLTTKSIEAARPAAARYELPDGGCRGLYFITQPSGIKSWAVRFRLNGKTAKLTLGQFPAVSLAEARKLAATAMEQVARGIDPGAAEREAKAADRGRDTHRRRQKTDKAGDVEAMREHLSTGDPAPMGRASGDRYRPQRCARTHSLHRPDQADRGQPLPSLLVPIFPLCSTRITSPLHQWSALNGRPKRTFAIAFWATMKSVRFGGRPTICRHRSTISTSCCCSAARDGRRLPRRVGAKSISSTRYG